jgi:YD repeat-containing protein
MDANDNTLAPDASAGLITRVEGGLTYTQAFDAENRLISVTVSGQTTQFIYDGNGNLVKKIKPDGSKTLYPSTTPQKTAAPLRAGVGGVYEVHKTAGGSMTYSHLLPCCGRDADR